MAIIKVICDLNNEYTPNPNGVGFIFKEQVYYHMTWQGLIAYFNSPDTRAAKFITDKPFNKEDWL